MMNGGRGQPRRRMDDGGRMTRLMSVIFLLSLSLCSFSIMRGASADIIPGSDDSDGAASALDLQECSAANAGKDCMDEDEVAEDHDYDGDEDWMDEDEVAEDYDYEYGNIDDPITKGDFYYANDCNNIMSSPRPVHNESTWVLLRGTYTAIMMNSAAERSSSERSSSSSSKSKSTIQFPVSYQSGFQIPFTVRQNPTSGRGVYATEDIKKGTRLWTSRTQGAMFYTGDEYRAFLNALRADLICDLLIWCYPTFYHLTPDNVDVSDEEGKSAPDEDMDKDGYYDEKGARLVIACDLDEGSFVNHAVNHDELTFGCDAEAALEYPGEGCMMHSFAVRDINAGEELKADYQAFAEADEWETFGL